MYLFRRTYYKDGFNGDLKSMLNQFKNLSCYEEFEIQCALTGISKVDVLKEIGHRIDDYYFFVSNDGIFNWFDLNGNYIKDPGVLTELKCKYIHDDITKCIIPNSVTSIGDNTFYHCKSLKEITISNNVTSIDNMAFAKCNSLISITIPDSVTSIGDYAFYKCKSLTSIIIPNNVIHIGTWAFTWCNALKEVIFEGKSLKQVKQMKNYHFLVLQTKAYLNLVYFFKKCDIIL